MRRTETALFIDGPNIYATSKALGFSMDYKALLSYYKTNTDLLRALYYTAVRERTEEVDSIRPLLDWLEYNEYTLVQKPTKEWADPHGGRPKIKGNMDIEMAVDALDLSQSIGQAVFFTGDGDFRYLLTALQRRGVRCVVVSSTKTQPSMCADELRRAADEFIELDDLVGRLGNVLLRPKSSRYG